MPALVQVDTKDVPSRPGKCPAPPPPPWSGSGRALDIQALLLLGKSHHGRCLLLVEGYASRQWGRLVAAAAANMVRKLSRLRAKGTRGSDPMNAERRLQAGFAPRFG